MWRRRGPRRGVHDRNTTAASRRGRVRIPTGQLLMAVQTPADGIGRVPTLAVVGRVARKRTRRPLMADVHPQTHVRRTWIFATERVRAQVPKLHEMRQLAVRAFASGAKRPRFIVAHGAQVPPKTHCWLPPSDLADAAGSLRSAASGTTAHPAAQFREMNITLQLRRNPPFQLARSLSDPRPTPRRDRVPQSFLSVAAVVRRLLLPLARSVAVSVDCCLG